MVTTASAATVLVIVNLDIMEKIAPTRNVQEHVMITASVSIGSVFVIGVGWDPVATCVVVHKDVMTTLTVMMGNVLVIQDGVERIVI